MKEDGYKIDFFSYCALCGKSANKIFLSLVKTQQWKNFVYNEAYFYFKIE